MEEIRIPEGELEIMKTLWEHSPQTLPEIVKNVQISNQWEAVTIKTMLGRLVKKNLVRQSGSRRSYVYEPLVSRIAALKSAGRQFMDRMFDGAPAAMISFFIKSGELTQSDIQKISRLIEEIKE